MNWFNRSIQYAKLVMSFSLQTPSGVTSNHYNDNIKLSKLVRSDDEFVIDSYNMSLRPFRTMCSCNKFLGADYITMGPFN